MLFMLLYSDFTLGSVIHLAVPAEKNEATYVDRDLPKFIGIAFYFRNIIWAILFCFFLLLMFFFFFFKSTFWKKFSVLIKICRN